MTSSASITALRGPGWEYRLSVLLLRSGLNHTRARHRQAIERIASRRNVLDTEKSLVLSKRLLEELIDWCRRFARFYPSELQAAWGPPGQDGDADAIIQACAKIVRHFEELIAWETAAAEAVCAPDCDGIFRRLRGSTRYYFAQTLCLLDEIETAARTGSGTQELRLVFDLPPRLIGLDRVIERTGSPRRPSLTATLLALAFGWLIGTTLFSGKGDDAC